MEKPAAIPKAGAERATRRRAAPQRGRSSFLESQDAQLLDNLATAVLLLDDRLCVQYANHAAEQLLATSFAHLRNQPLGQFFRAEEKNLSSLREALISRQPYTQREMRLRNAGGRDESIVDCTVMPFAAAADHSPRLLIELHPLDRRIHINREDNLFATNQATRALVRGMAHEIKNPLGGIRGAAQLLARELDCSQLQEYTDVIINEADRLRNLVDRMLGARRPPEFKCINIHQILERVRRVLQAETGSALHVTRDYDPSLPEVRADADQLIQVFLNIVRNAAQSLLEMTQPAHSQQAFSPRIVIRTRALHQFSIGARRHPLLCLIEVEDNGPGIGESLREILFYPMVTGRSQGTGLGLPIAQSIMLQHGGLIECDSKPGKTVFKILLPFDPPAESDPGVAADAAQ